MSEEVAIRRKKDGLYFIGKGRFVTAPKFVASLARAHMIVRIDIGADLTDYDYPTRQAFALNPEPTT